VSATQMIYVNQRLNHCPATLICRATTAKMLTATKMTLVMVTSTLTTASNTRLSAVSQVDGNCRKMRTATKMNHATRSQNLQRGTTWKRATAPNIRPNSASLLRRRSQKTRVAMRMEYPAT
jgi:hypothetical protein